MPILVYNGAREQTFSMYIEKNGGRTAKNIRLVPGQNPITQADYDCLCETSDGFKYFKDETNDIRVIEDNKSIVVKEDDNGDSVTGIDITELSAADAKQVIGETFNNAVLDQFVEQETKGGNGRPSVMKAFEAQVELLASGEDDDQDEVE